MTSPNSTPNIGISPTPDHANPRIRRPRPRKTTSVQFTMVSKAMLADPRLKPVDIVVASALELIGYSTGKVWACAETIGKKCNVCANTVRAAIARLEEAGYVLKEAFKSKARRVIQLLFMRNPKLYPHLEEVRGQGHEPHQVTSPVEDDFREICAPKFGDKINKKDKATPLCEPTAESADFDDEPSELEFEPEPEPEPEPDLTPAPTPPQIAEIERTAHAVTEQPATKHAFANAVQDVFGRKGWHRAHYRTANMLAQGVVFVEDVLEAVARTFETRDRSARNGKPLTNLGAFYLHVVTGFVDERYGNELLDDMGALTPSEFLDKHGLCIAADPVRPTRSLEWPDEFVPF